MNPQVPDEMLKSLTKNETFMYAIVFLLAGGMAFLILREVFKFLKEKESNKKKTSVLPLDEQRNICANQPEMILLFDKTERIECAARS